MKEVAINEYYVSFEDYRPAIEALSNDGVIIYPTDSVYGLACDVNSVSAMSRICEIRNIKMDKALFTLTCSSLSEISDYTPHLSNAMFKAMKNYFPGPYTFILPASKRLPKSVQNKKKTIGVRIPKDPVVVDLLKYYEKPIWSMSLKDDEGVVQTDPYQIAEHYAHKVDVFLNNGEGSALETTVFDATGNELEVIREGAGEI